MGTHETAVDEYVKTLNKFSNSHPIIVGLQEMARQLDKKFMTSLAAQLQLTLRYIESVENEDNGEEEEEDTLLSPNR